MTHWQECYETLLNPCPVPAPVTLRETASMAVSNHSIPVHTPTTPEVDRVISRLRLHQAPGICGISAELLKAGGGVLHCLASSTKLGSLAVQMSDTETLQTQCLGHFGTGSEAVSYTHLTLPTKRIV